jgi:uncharacterized membrane protein
MACWFPRWLERVRVKDFSCTDFANHVLCSKEAAHANWWRIKVSLSLSLSLSLSVFISVLGTIILLDILLSIQWMVIVTPLIITHTHTRKRCIKRLWLSYHLRDYTIRPVLYDWVPRYLLVSGSCCIKFLLKGL